MGAGGGWGVEGKVPEIGGGGAEAVAGHLPSTGQPASPGVRGQVSTSGWCLVASAPFRGRGLPHQPALQTWREVPGEASIWVTSVTQHGALVGWRGGLAWGKAHPCPGLWGHNGSCEL